MDIEQLHLYLLGKSEVTEGFPFGPEVLVFKVCGKMFATLACEEVPLRMNLKCDPERAIELRDSHDSILPGYHMNKKHWNTLVLDGTFTDELLCELIDDSYVLSAQGLKVADRKRLGVY